MSRENRLYTFLIAPTPTSRVRRLSIHRNLFYIAGGVLVVMLALTIYGLVQLVRTEAMHMENISLRSQNIRLKEANDQYQEKYSKIKGQISYVQDISRELARQTKMERPTDVDQQVGIGGPETVSFLDKAADHLESEVRRLSDRLRSNILRLASIPTGLPVKGYITDGFGSRRNPFGGEGREVHEGLDIAVDFGTPVAATADGLIVYAAPYAGYGNLVIIYHNNGITTRYGHLSKITAEAGQRIKRGDQIGHAGSTGRSTGPHVHYEVRENDQAVDPLRYVGESNP